MGNQKIKFKINKKRGEESEGKTERRREKGRDEREGMRGYLETPPPYLAAVSTGGMLLALIASLDIVSFLISCVFSCVFSMLYFCVIDV